MYYITIKTKLGPMPVPAQLRHNKTDQFYLKQISHSDMNLRKQNSIDEQMIKLTFYDTLFYILN